MGLSKIMQPRALTSTDDGRPPSPVPEASVPAPVSQGLVPIGSDSSPSTRPARKKKPKPVTDKRLRKVVGLILALKVQGRSRREIAEELELSENTVRTYLYRAKKKGYLKTDDFDDPNDILETIIKPKVVENVEKLLDWRHAKTGLPSMEMTIETAKGVGIFQQHSVAKGPTGPVQNANVLRVQIVMPPNTASGVEVKPGTMGGRQSDAVVEGEVVDES